LIIEHVKRRQLGSFGELMTALALVLGEVLPSQHGDTRRATPDVSNDRNFPCYPL